MAPCFPSTSLISMYGSVGVRVCVRVSTPPFLFQSPVASRMRESQALVGENEGTESFAHFQAPFLKFLPNPSHSFFREIFGIEDSWGLTAAAFLF